MTRQENGQVTPALLLAVIGAFALVTMFFVVAQSQEQSSRSDTAADAAALGAGREFERELGAFLSEGDLFAQILNADSFFPEAAADAAAQQYAEANGAEVTDTDNEGFDLRELEWRYSVEVKQLDKLEYQGEDETSESRATVAVKIINGLCFSADEDAPGFMIDGQCVGPTELQEICAPEEPEEGTPPEEGEPPEEEDPEEDAPSCPTSSDIIAGLQTEMRLVAQS